jgi:hypothetical protein
LSTVVQIGVMAVMNSHIYSFGGKYFLQKKGGPIGLRATCAIARITMLDWDRKWLDICQKNNLELVESGRYMDDLRVFLHEIKVGWRWHKGELCFCEEWEEEDRRTGKGGLERTRDILQQSMKNVYEFLRMTMETGLDFSDGKLPTLDVKVWINEKNQVLYSFFEKPMVCNQVLQKSTALAEDTKVSSLVQEVYRRMSNVSELVELEERLAVIDRFGQKMCNSGYGMEQTRRIIVSGLKGYEGRVRQQKDGGREIHEGAANSQNARYKKKLTGKVSWFKTSKKTGAPTGRKETSGKSPPTKRGVDGRTGDRCRRMEPAKNGV